jgi:ribosome-associated protein
MTFEIEPGWTLDAQALTFRYVRSSGPGGQNVNKVATKVELRFDVVACTSLSQAQKVRLRRAFPGFHTSEGTVVLTSERHRTQAQNKSDAVDKLFSMLRAIRRPPKRRVKTVPTRASKTRRLEQKRRRAVTKRDRRSPDAA